jgi:hypothetical protein
MNRYVKAVFGGLLALLAAFGWTIACAFLVVRRDTGWGTELLNELGRAWIVLVAIFSAGFFLAFRAAYFKNSN